MNQSPDGDSMTESAQWGRFSKKIVLSRSGMNGQLLVQVGDFLNKLVLPGIN